MIRLVETDWFRLVEDVALTAPVRPVGLSYRAYPYFMEEKSFRRLSHKLAAYQPQAGMEYCDFLFAPTFMVGDRFQLLFKWLAPEMEFCQVTLMPVPESAEAKPLHYWVPFLPIAAAGQRIRCQRQRDKVTWLFSLAAAESILRRAPLGIRFEPVEVEGWA